MLLIEQEFTNQKMLSVKCVSYAVNKFSLIKYITLSVIDANCVFVFRSRTPSASISHEPSSYIGSYKIIIGVVIIFTFTILRTKIIIYFNKDNLFHADFILCSDGRASEQENSNCLYCI